MPGAYMPAVNAQGGFVKNGLALADVNSFDPFYGRAPITNSAAG